jgi:hypothetical protein
MRKFALAFAWVGVALIPALNAAPASAQIPHTYVMQSGSGTACTYAAPCNVVQTAINATSSGGDVYILDGDYSENIVITQSLSITGNLNAGVIIRATTTNGTNTTVTINGSAGTNVSLSNLTIYPDLNGVVFNGGRRLQLNGGTSVPGALNIGVIFQPTTPTSGSVPRLQFGNVSASGTNGGVLVKPGAGVAVDVNADNLRTGNSLYGMKVDNTGGSGAIKVNVQGSTAFRNTNNGYVVIGTGAGHIAMVVDRTTIDTNGVDGVVAAGANASVLVTGSTLTNNGGTGLAQLAGAFVESTSDNSFAFNGADTSGTITPIVKK